MYVKCVSVYVSKVPLMVYFNNLQLCIGNTILRTVVHICITKTELR